MKGQDWLVTAVGLGGGGNHGEIQAIQSED